MRAIEAAAGARARPGGGGARSGFGEALRSADRRAADGGRAGHAERDRRPDGVHVQGARGGATERSGEAKRARRDEAARGSRRGVVGGPEPADGRHLAAQGDAGVADAAAGPGGPLPPAAELASVVRALPVAIAAARVPDGAPLTLSFGRSLDVELRAGPAGIEVVLRPEPGLAGAAEAELPRMLAALRGRGIAVARAAVRSRGAAAAARFPPRRGGAAGAGGEEAGGGEAR